MLHREIPFIRICLPFCAGIISGLYFRPGPAILLTAIILILSAFLTSLFFNRQESNGIYGFAMTFSLLLCGNMLYTNDKNGISKLNPGQTILTGTLSDYPAEKSRSFLLTLRLQSMLTEKGPEPLHGSILMYHSKDSLVPRLIPGDILVIKCSPAEIRVRGNPYEFDYSFYMECQGVKYYAYTTAEDVLKHYIPKHRKLKHKALILRERIIQMYSERGIKGERLALVAAITLGQKNMLDADQKNYFVKAGVMHIMAVSGLHTVILSLFVFNVLFFLKGRFNIIRILITLIILWAFAFITGLTPSVLRATLMFSFLQAGSLMKRPANGINSVLASAFILIMIRPSVIFDAGFLLSYSAVIYIIAFYRDLYQAIAFKHGLMDKIWQSAAVTIVAQAGTLPLTITLFNRFPVYFILTNIIIVPLSSLLVIIGCIIPLIYPVKFLSHLLAMLLSSLTGLTELLTKSASSLPLASVENIGMTTTGCILFSVFIFLFSCFLRDKKSVPLIWALGSLLLLLLAGTVREIHTRKSNELIVYNTPGFSTIGIRTGKILNLYTDTVTAGNEVKRHSSSLGLEIRMHRVDAKSQYIIAGDKRLLITNQLTGKMLEGFSPDIIVLSGAKPEIALNANEGPRPETTIISAAGLPEYLYSPRRKGKSSFRVFLVRRSGAYIRRI